MPAAHSTEELRDLNPRRVCLIKPSALGDVCRTTPVLASLRDAFPLARIDWLVHEAFTDAIRVDDVVIVAAARTPQGRLDGSLAALRAVDLGGAAIRGALANAGIGPAEVDMALGHAAVHGRFGDKDLAAILDHRTTGTSGTRHQASEDNSLTQGTSAWSALNGAQEGQA